MRRAGTTRHCVRCRIGTEKGGIRPFLNSIAQQCHAGDVRGCTRVSNGGLYPMNIEVVPISEVHIEGFRAGLDSVARERMYLAQVEAPPIESVTAFVRNSIATDAAHFVATDRSLVVGWCDILPAWAPAVRHRGTLGMGTWTATIRGAVQPPTAENAERGGITVPTTSAISAVNSPGLPIRPHGPRLR